MVDNVDDCVKYSVNTVLQDQLLINSCAINHTLYFAVVVIDKDVVCVTYFGYCTYVQPTSPKV